MKVQAYRCRFTGELFDNPQDFAIHLAELRNCQRQVRAVRKHRSELNSVFLQMREQTKSLDQLTEFIQSHWLYFCANNWANRGNHHEDFDTNSWPTLTHLKFTSMRWYDSASNSHCCPLNGVTNWFGSKQLPTGYPGWVGSIVCGVSHDDCRGFLSDFFKGTGINLGSGGGGFKNIRYSVTLFAGDWPGLSSQITWNILNNQHLDLI